MDESAKEAFFCDWGKREREEQKRINVSRRRGCHSRDRIGCERFAGRQNAHKVIQASHCNHRYNQNWYGDSKFDQAASKPRNGNSFSGALTAER